MKGNKIIVGFWFLVAIGIMLSSCTKVNNKETIVLIGRESYIRDIEEIFSKNPVCKASFDSVKKYMDLNYGSIPPKIGSSGGKYIVEPTIVFKSNVEYMPNSTVMPEVYLGFEHQHNGIVTVEFVESSIPLVTDTAYIMGNNQDFTVYFPEKREFDQPYNGVTYHVTMERGIIMSGSVTPEGLSDFCFASIVMNTEVEPQGNLPLYDIGTYFIYKDGNGLAEKRDW